MLIDGALIEKGGVNVSLVHGDLPSALVDDLPGEGGRTFVATGLSLVIHPRSPHVPTVHANFRYFERTTEEGRTTAWFGGGADLTPWILYEEDAVHFHQAWADVCGRHRVAEYAALKHTCDRYFYLPHRGETRGVGGIFFDHLGAPSDAQTPPCDLEEAAAFVRDAANSFLEAYVPIVERRRGLPVTEAERDWQLRRRGRYVEFNLLYDRGTAFGLRTQGRTESILMSLPPLVRWGYCDEPQTAEQTRLVDALRSPRDWLDDHDPLRA